MSLSRNTATLPIDRSVREENASVPARVEKSPVPGSLEIGVLEPLLPSGREDWSSEDEEEIRGGGEEGGVLGFSLQGVNLEIRRGEVG